MADTAASVLALLKNKGKETGRSYQLCLQLFCQEEFLRRFGIGSTENLPDMDPVREEEIRVEVEEEMKVRFDEAGQEDTQEDT